VLKVSHASSQASALQKVRQGDLDGAVSQQGDRLVLHYSIADQVTSGVVRALFSSLVQAANQEATGKPPAFTLATAQVEDTSLKPIQYIAPGLLAWAIASGATFGAAITLVSWRQKKLLRRLRLTPASTGAIAAARITVSLLIALVQLAVFLLIATTSYFGLKLTAWWWMAIPIVIAGALTFLSIGLLAGSITRTEQAATALANLIILPMAFLGGAFVPLAFAPAWIQKVSYVMPLRYLVVGVQDVMARGDGPSAAVLPIAILLGIAAVLTLVAVRLFRWDEI
jgi:ABC-2 type transport system permease protein